METQIQLKLRQSHLEKLNSHIKIKGIPQADLIFPCHDKSEGVRDFRDWSYFKNERPQKVVNVGSSRGWSKSFLDRLNHRKEILLEQRDPLFVRKPPKLPPVRSTKTEAIRAHYINTMNPEISDRTSSRAEATRGHSSKASVHYQSQAASLKGFRRSVATSA
jgi:hypothetical protein